MKRNVPELLAHILRVPAGLPGPHVSDDDLDSYAAGTLSAEARDKVDYHCERCTECAEILERLIEAASAPEAPPFPILVPDFKEVLARHERQEQAGSMSLAASSKSDLPEYYSLQGLLPGFTGEASGDDRFPDERSCLRLSHKAAESPRPEGLPGNIFASWPTGKSEPFAIEFQGGRWRCELSIQVSWPELVDLLEQGKLMLHPYPPA